MFPPDSRDRFTLLLTGLLVLFTPLVFLAVTLSFLSFAEGFESEELSVLELVELYVIEAVVVLVFAYLVYRLTLFFVEERLPESLDALSGEEEAETEDVDSPPE